MVCHWVDEWPMAPPSRFQLSGYLGYTATNSKDHERHLAPFGERLCELTLVVGDDFVVGWHFAE